MNVAIRYGFTEGTWHGKKFRRMLRERGHQIVQEERLADIVIAHSGGCFDMPPLKESAILMFINPPYWPERPLRRRASDMTRQLARAIRPGNQPFYHTHKTARNLGYLVRHARTNHEMMRRAITFNLADEINHMPTILVRNSNDPWLTPDLDGLQQRYPQLRIARLPGDHDDCWLHPEPYIHLLESET